MRYRDIGYKLDVKLDIRNFGPISKGTIHLKPLTIFIGPNNSGKTYASTLIYSILSPQRPHGYFGVQKSNARNMSKKILKSQESFVVNNTIMRQYDVHARNSLALSMKANIENNFGTDAENLIQKNHDLAKIIIQSPYKTTIKINKKFDMDVDTTESYAISINSSKNNDDVSISQNGKEITDTINKYDEKLTRWLDRMLIRIAYNKLKVASYDKLKAKEIKENRQVDYSDIPIDILLSLSRESSVQYFPAARLGILQQHRRIKRDLLQYSKYKLLGQKLPATPGISMDFLVEFENMHPQRKGHYYKLANQLEQDLFKGTIEIVNHKEMPTTFNYKTKIGNIPLHLTSSAISEMAPISLHLKYGVRPGDFLIIEEPEAHLHPTNQLIFARYIVRMIRQGINILLTTHSVYLLEAIGQYILSDRISQKERIRIGLGKDDYLSPDEVSPYLFNKSSRGSKGDSKITPIEITEEDGIPQDEFIKVSDIIFKKHVQIENILEKQNAKQENEK